MPSIAPFGQYIGLDVALGSTVPEILAHILHGLFQQRNHPSQLRLGHNVRRTHHDMLPVHFARPAQIPQNVQPELQRAHDDLAAETGINLEGDLIVFVSHELDRPEKAPAPDIANKF